MSNSKRNAGGSERPITVPFWLIALLAVLINELTYPAEPDYGKATETTGTPPSPAAPPTPQTPKTPGASAGVVPGGALLMIKGVF